MSRHEHMADLDGWFDAGAVKEHLRSEGPAPLSRLWVRGLIIQVVTGELAHEEAQQRTAYFTWRKRELFQAKGDALGDWLEAAQLLNGIAAACELDPAPW